MPTTIIDLDEFLGDDKQVKLGGKVYRLPPDLPAEMYLRINRYAKANPELGEFEAIEQLYEQALELFRYGDPTIKELPLTLTQCFTLIARVYGGGSEEEQPARPPQRSRSGGATKSGSRTTVKRSR